MGYGSAPHTDMIAAMGPPPTPFVQRLAELILFFGILFGLGTLTPSFRPDVNLLYNRGGALENESSAFNQIFWLGLAGLSIALAASAPRRLVSLLPYCVPLGLLCIYVLASSVWALAPDIAFRRAILFVIVVAVMGIGVIYSKSPKRVLQVLYLAFLVTLIANLASLPVPAAYHTSAFEKGLFRGIMGGKNMLSAAGFMAILVGMVSWRARSSLPEKGIWAFYMLGWLLVILLAGSKTILALLVLLPVVIGVLGAIRSVVPVSPVTIIVVGIVFALTVLAFVVLGLGIPMATLMNMLPDPTLTNRTFLWEYTMTQIAERPMLGYGFQSFWGIGYDSPAARSPVIFARQVNQAHNGYIDLLINLGIVGTALFAWMMLGFLSRLRQVGRYSSKYRFLIWIFFLFTMFHNMTETSFMRYNIGQWMMFVVFFFWVIYISMLLNPKYARETRALRGGAGATAVRTARFER